MQSYVSTLGAVVQFLSRTHFDALFQHLKLMYNYALLKPEVNPLSLGPEGKEADSHIFRVPHDRN